MWVLRRHLYTRGIFQAAEKTIAEWIVDTANELEATNFRIVEQSKTYADVAFYLGEK